MVALADSHAQSGAGKRSIEKLAHSPTDDAPAERERGQSLLLTLRRALDSDCGCAETAAHSIRAGESTLAGDRFEKATQRASCESQNSTPTADADANESTMDSQSLKNGQP